MHSKWADYIDHTALKPETSKEEIITLCEEAKKYSFISVCVNPAWVKTAAEILADTDVKVCTVIGFPLGASTIETKVFETKNAIENGAREIDMVINIGALKSGDIQLVRDDIHAVVKEAGDQALVKVIIETSLLTDNEKKSACKAAADANADFVKTSTGFSGSGATIEDIRLMRNAVGTKLGVKASGGIRTFETMKQMIEAGATRIGASAGVQILKEASK